MNYFDEVIKYDPVNHYILFSKEDLVKMKENFTKSELDDLKEKLNCINLDYETERKSVIYKKNKIAGIEDKDYVSLATYYWPDPEKPNGLPYILRDGESNPEGDFYDKNNLRLLAFNVYYQCILYYLTEEKEYYNSMVKNIKYYFLDETTGMNPNFSHAQMRKGVDLGRGIGFIDFTANFSYALWMMKQLRELGLLEETFDNDMKNWLEQLYQWILYHPISLQERYADNNHGTFFDFGLLMVCDYLGKKEEIEPIAHSVINLRMIRQFASDGSLPQECARTKSKSYSLMGYKGFTDSAVIMKEYGFDLWNTDSWYYKKLDKYLYNGFNFLKERLIEKKVSWDYAQITIYDESTIVPLLYTGFKQQLINDDCFNNIDTKNVFDDIIYMITKKAV